MGKKCVFSLVLGLLALGGLWAQAGGTLYVAVKSAPVRAQADLFANTLGALDYGTPVTVLRSNQKWAQVRTQAQPSLSGWVSLASLTSRRPSSSGASTDVSELALAGKGFDFSAELEGAYQRDEGLSFDLVDRMEAAEVPSRELYQFLTEGRLGRGN